MIGSSSEHRGKKSSDDDDENSVLLCTCQNSEETFKTFNIALLKVAALTPAATTHSAKKLLQRCKCFGKHIVQIVDAWWTPRRLELLPHYSRTTSSGSLYHKHQWTVHRRTTSQWPYRPTFYISHAIQFSQLYKKLTYVTQNETSFILVA